MRSTKQKDRKKAMQVAEKWEAAAQKARRGELTQAASVKILRDMMEVTTGDELRAPSIAETVNGYLASRATLGRASSTATRYKPIAASFSKPDTALSRHPRPHRMRVCHVRSVVHPWVEIPFPPGALSIGRRGVKGPATTQCPVRRRSSSHRPSRPSHGSRDSASDGLGGLASLFFE